VRPAERPLGLRAGEKAGLASRGGDPIGKPRRRPRRHEFRVLLILL
jgi:hypothetical protein